MILNLWVVHSHRPLALFHSSSMAPPFEKGVPLGGNQVRMKESDKRRFRERIGKLYPKCGEEQLAALVPSNKSVALFSAN